jgi:hypothetical protein
MNYVFQSIVGKILSKYFSNVTSELLIYNGSATFKKIEVNKESVNGILNEQQLDFKIEKGLFD